MNKLILLFCLFVAITTKCNKVNAEKLDDCKNSTLDDDEKKGGEDKCCLLTTNNTKFCQAYVQSKVLDQVKEGKKNDSNFSIDCTSNWISFSLYLVALLFMI